MASGGGVDFVLNQPNRADDCRQVDVWGAITGWQTDFQQVGRGTFDGSLTVGFQEDVQINRNVFNRELLIHASPPKGVMSLIFPYSPGRRGVVEGRELEQRQVVVVPDGMEGFFRTAEQVAYHAIMLPQVRMEDLIRKNHPEVDGLPGGRVTTFPEAAYHSVLAASEMVLDGSVADAPLRLTEALMDGFCAPLEELAGPRRLRNRLRYVRRAKDYFEEHLTKGASLTGASAAVGVNRRTLELAFKDVLDMSPLDYLRTRRLRAIRETLRSEPEKYRTQRIGALATRYGMTHAGHFSRDYKMLFGELPQETVRV